MASMSPSRSRKCSNRKKWRFIIGAATMMMVIGYVSTHVFESFESLGTESRTEIVTKKSNSSTPVLKISFSRSNSSSGSSSSSSMTTGEPSIEEKTSQHPLVDPKQLLLLNLSPFTTEADDASSSGSSGGGKNANASSDLRYSSCILANTVDGFAMRGGYCWERNLMDSPSLSTPVPIKFAFDHRWFHFTGDSISRVAFYAFVCILKGCTPVDKHSTDPIDWTVGTTRISWHFSPYYDDVAKDIRGVGNGPDAIFSITVRTLLGLSISVLDMSD